MKNANPVVVVGAGLAGLSCAVELTVAGVECIVLEASDDVGGRVRTDVVDGFRLDRGFQVLLTAYPEAQRLLDYRALRLRPFFPGALIRCDGRFRRLADPWRRPMAGLGGLLDRTVGVADALRILRFRARCSTALDRQRSAPRSTVDRLAAEGFSRAIIDRFFRPFFGGVFLDRELTTSEEQLEFVFSMFAAGDIAVPALGMGEIPRQLAARLPQGSVRLNANVNEVAANHVLLSSGDRLEADAVVVATDGTAAATLMDLGEAPTWRGTTCLYFAADEAPARGPFLVLDGEAGGPVNNLCVMSEVAPETAPGNSTLISVTVIGFDSADEAELETAVRGQLRSWFGATVDRWRLLRSYRIDRALPDQSAPGFERAARSPRIDGLYVCGDHRADSSINGAMASGRAAARAVQRDLSPR